MSSIVKARKPYTLLAVVAALIVALAPRAGAHDVPNEVTVSGFVHPEGQTLTVLLRVPMKSLRDVDIPTFTTGFLDFSRVDQTLRDATVLWGGWK